MKLTQRQERFCREVVKGRSYTDAYRAAYSTKNLKESTLWTEAYKTHTLPHVSNRIHQLQEQAAERLLMSRQQYLERLEGMVLADVRRIMDPQGNVIDVNAFPDDVTELIEGIEVVENFQKVGDKAEHVGYTKKIKFAGKRGLLKDYGEARGWLESPEERGPKRIIHRKYVEQEVHYHGIPNGLPGPVVIDVTTNGHGGNGHRELQSSDGGADPGSGDESGPVPDAG